MTREESFNQYNARSFLPNQVNSECEFYYEKEAFADWCERSEGLKGKKTIRTQKSLAERLYYYFSAMGTLSEENVKLYGQASLDNGLASTTINSRLTALKTYIRFLADKYNAPDLKRFKIKLYEIHKKQYIENVISRADFEFLINQAKEDLNHPNVYLGIKIMGTTGLRRVELYQVKVEHIKHGYVDVIGKGNKQRRIYFPKKARVEILEYLSRLNVDSGYVIRRWQDPEYPYYNANTRDQGVYDEIKKMDRMLSHQLEQAGIRYGIPQELMHAHGFRHFFAKEFLKHRLDISLLADLLGHSSLEVTRIYLKMTSREQADVVDEVVDW